jgi:hypothetical protein
MLEYIAPGEMKVEDFLLLEQSFLAAPETDRPSRAEIASAIMSGRSKIFRTAGLGIVMVRLLRSATSRRLLIEAICMPQGGFIKAWAADLKRLARDWSCDTIETTSFDPRLTRAIKHCGAQVEAVVLTLEVGR